jgi:uncharacterized protein with PIN domain
MKKVFDKELLENYISVCNVDFFERLVFKPFYISRPKYNEFSVSKVEFICDSCKSKINRIKGFEFNNNSFRSVGKCSECKKTYWLNVRAKQTYDGIVVSAKALEMNKKRAKKVEQ